MKRRARACMLFVRGSTRTDRGTVIKSVVLLHVIALFTVLVVYRAMSPLSLTASRHRYNYADEPEDFFINYQLHHMPSTSFEHYNILNDSLIITVSKVEALHQILFHKDRLKVKIAHAEQDKWQLLSAIRQIEEQTDARLNYPSQYASSAIQGKIFANKTDKKIVEDMLVVPPSARIPEENVHTSDAVPQLPISSLPIAVLVIACDRPTVKRNLDLLLKYRDATSEAGGVAANMTERFPIVVSQDCGHAATGQIINSFLHRHNGIIHIKQPDRSNIAVKDKSEAKFQGYYKICRHYRWALNQVFHTLNYSAVVIVEDDLDVAPDFFEYFQATLPVLMADKTLWCVSAWNDNGKPDLIEQREPELLHRTDFFPGLGWMMLRTLWNELEPKWPEKFWDDWMRRPEQRQNRSCIRPEIPRTITFGKKGVSKGQFFDQHLKFIKLNNKKVPFSRRDLRYLLKSIYDLRFNRTVYAASAVTLQNVKSGSIANVDPLSPVRLTYQTKSDFIRLANDLGAMVDLKAGVARTAYRGVVMITYRERRVFLAPPVDWVGYDTSWS